MLRKSMKNNSIKALYDTWNEECEEVWYYSNGNYYEWYYNYDEDYEWCWKYENSYYDDCEYYNSYDINKNYRRVLNLIRMPLNDSWYTKVYMDIIDITKIDFDFMKKYLKLKKKSSKRCLEYYKHDDAIIMQRYKELLDIKYAKSCVSKMFECESIAETINSFI